MGLRTAQILLCVFCFSTSCLAAVLDIRNFGAQPSSDSTLAIPNRDAFNKALAAAQPGDHVVVPEGLTFIMLGGVLASNLYNVTVHFDGTLVADPDYDNWPMMTNNKDYVHFIEFDSCAYLTLTSTGQGQIIGNGVGWWNREILPSIFGKLKGKRPKLVVVEQATDLLVEYLHLSNSPSFHLLIADLARAEVRYVNVTVDRSSQATLKAVMSKRLLAAQGLDATSVGATGLEPQDLNTDGIDPSGRDIWIHDCYIQNDDDSIAVKPCDGSGGCVNAQCSENILIENMVLTGFGASIGSVPPHEGVNCVRNVTFRNIFMPRTGKGVYIKSNPTCRPGATGIIDSVLFEDVHILYPRWWSIWIGPQQQQEPGSELGTKCSLTYPLFNASCPTQGCVSFTNITLRRVTVDQPVMSPGVVMGNSTNPMDVTFEDVVVNFSTLGGLIPYGRKYKCTHTNGVALGATNPVPSCFTQK